MKAQQVASLAHQSRALQHNICVTKPTLSNTRDLTIFAFTVTEKTTEEQ